MARSVSAPPTRRRRWRQRWILTALGLVFAASAILRIGTLDFAFAQSGSSPTPASAMSAVVPGVTQSIQAALTDIETLRQEMMAREAALADREQAVAAAQRLVESRLAELEAAEQRLAGLIAMSDSAAEGDLDRLTRVYETMPPAEAAKIFEQMQPSFAAGFLSRMTPDASANLMAALTPEQAYALSVVIATRNSSAPRLATERSAPSETEN